MDGRLFMRTATGTYETIFVDAFGVPLTVPFELLTKEAFTELGKLLAEDGVVIMNIVGSVTGPGDAYTASIIKTLYEVYPNVGVYQVGALPKEAIQNLIVVVSKSVAIPHVPLKSRIHTEVLYPVEQSFFDRPGALVLTDDYAPTEALARPMRNAILKTKQ
jgi:spermidine synthase